MINCPPEVKSVEKLYTLEEAAAYLHCTVRTVRTWIKDRDLKAVKIGRRLLIKESVLEAFVKKHEEEQ